MKVRVSLLKKRPSGVAKTQEEKDQEMLVRVAKEQFEKLGRLGLTVPIALL